MFLNIFGKKTAKKEDTSSSTIQAIFKLKETLTLQEKKEEFLEKTIEKMKNDAKKYVQNNNKKKAISILKLCKMKEKNLDQLYGIKSNLENQIFLLEQSINNEVVINSIKNGKKVLDTIKTKYDIDDTTELMDEINEHIVTSSEIGDILSQPIGTTYDENELLNELNEEEMISNLTTNLHISKPKSVETVEKDEEEKTLRELEKEFNFPETPTNPISVPVLDKSQVSN